MSQVPVRKRAEGVSESTEVLHEMDLLARDNPRSVINIVPAEVQAHIFRAVKDRPDLFRMPEKILRKEVQPTPTDSRLRLAFWNEFNQADSNHTTMRMGQVYAGICTLQYFHGPYLTDPRNVAWLLCPPSSYIVALEEIINRSQNKLSEILDCEVIDEDGKVDVKLGELILKIHLATESRLRGAVVVRSHVTHAGEVVNKNLNVNANVAVTADEAAKVVDKMVRAGSIDDVNERLAKLRKEDKREERKKEREVAAGQPRSADEK